MNMLRRVLISCVALCVAAAQGTVFSDPPSPPWAGPRHVNEENLPPDLGTRSQGEDWPSFLGPNRDSRSSETGLPATWPAEGPRIVWQRESGTGYGAGSVSRGRYFHFDRGGDRARLFCLQAELGTELWNFEYPTDFVDMYGYDGGPRCSPVVDGDRVYIYGAEGMLHCLRVQDGSVIWKCDTIQQFGVVKNFFGVGSTPVSKVICSSRWSAAARPKISPSRDGQLDRVRGNGTGIVAFDKLTGAVKYALTNELASYSSPVVATVRDRRRGFAFCRGGLVVFFADTGLVNFRVPWRSELLESVNASTPVVVDNQVLIAEAYGPGSCLISVEPTGYQFVWRDSRTSRRKAMRTHFNTPVYDQGYVYGCSGRFLQETELRCVEWKTGQVMWSKPTRIRSSLLYVDRHLINLEEQGTLQLIKANPQQFELVAEVTLRPKIVVEPATTQTPPALLKHPCWAAPVLSHGLLYLRGADQLVCLELIPPGK